MSIIKVVLKIYLSMTFLFYVPWGCLVLKKVDTKVNKNGQRKKKKTKRKF